MAIKLLGSSITSVYKSVASTVSKTVSKVSGGSSSKSSSTNSKSSSSGNKTSASSNSKSSSLGNKTSVSTSNKTSSSGNKTSATATSKTVNSNVSSTSKQSTTTKYVTNAAAIYNASGKKVSTPSSVSTGRPAQSYATQAKTSTTNSQKSTESSTTVKTTTAKAKTVTSTSVKSTSTKAPSSVSTGRPAQSYATQKKVSATSSQKTSGNSSSVKTTNAKVKTATPTVSKTTNNKSPLSISNGRPEQSYSTQKKASTTYNQKTTGNSSKQPKLPVPVAPKAPVIKKDPSEASYSNNRPEKSYTHVVAYKPSPSREGAGQMFYMSKTDPKGAKAGASFATSCIPYVGDAKDIQKAVTGKDLITGKKLTDGDRLLTIAAAGLPVVSEPMLKSVKEGGTIAVKKAPDALKGAEKLIKKNAPKVKKIANKTDVAEDTAKAMKKKAVEKVKDTKELSRTVGKGSSSPIELSKYDGKTTHGVLVLDDGTQIPFSSGNANPEYKNYISASHVEGKSAIYMRENGVNKATVFHNNTDGICPYCDKMLPTLLEEGASLKVVPPSNASAPKPSWVDTVKVYIGNDKMPKKPK